MKRFALLLAVLSVTACSAAPPDDSMSGGPDAGVEDEVTPGAVPLDVSPLPPTTIFSSLPVSGHGPPGGVLLYDVPNRGQYSADLGTDGSFCVDVPLQMGTVNEISFQAIDAQGRTSDPIVVSTTQDGEPPAPPPPDTDNGVRNIAVGSTTYMTDLEVSAGSLQLLTDGNRSAAVTLEDSFGFWTWNHLAIKLTERASIYAVKVTTSSDCPMEEFEWFLSNKDAPTYGPATDEPEWTFQQYITTAGTEHMLWPSLAEPTALWLGIDFESGDCGGFTGGVHKILEVEVFTRDQASGTTPPPPENPNPTCASGGIE